MPGLPTGAPAAAVGHVRARARAEGHPFSPLSSLPPHTHTASPPSTPPTPPTHPPPNHGRQEECQGGGEGHRQKGLQSRVRGRERGRRERIGRGERGKKGRPGVRRPPQNLPTPARAPAGPSPRGPPEGRGRCREGGPVCLKAVCLTQPPALQARPPFFAVEKRERGGGRRRGARAARARAAARQKKKAGARARPPGHARTHTHTKTTLSPLPPPRTTHTPPLTG